MPHLFRLILILATWLGSAYCLKHLGSSIPQIIRCICKCTRKKKQPIHKLRFHMHFDSKDVPYIMKIIILTFINYIFKNILLAKHYSCLAHMRRTVRCDLDCLMAWESTILGHRLPHSAEKCLVSTKSSCCGLMGFNPPKRSFPILNNPKSRSTLFILRCRY